MSKGGSKLAGSGCRASERASERERERERERESERERERDQLDGIIAVGTRARACTYSPTDHRPNKRTDLLYAT